MNLKLTIAGLVLTCCAGCASYQAGTPEPVARSVWIEPVRNESFAPQVELLLGERLRHAILSGPGVQLTFRDEADALLEVTVLDFQREGRAHGLDVAEPDGSAEPDRNIARAFDLTLVARVRLLSADSGDVLLDRTLRSNSQSIPHPSVSSAADAERLMMPLLARDMARQIHGLLIGGWSSNGQG